MMCFGDRKRLFEIRDTVLSLLLIRSTGVITFIMTSGSGSEITPCNKINKPLYIGIMH